MLTGSDVQPCSLLSSSPKFSTILSDAAKALDAAGLKTNVFCHTSVTNHEREPNTPLGKALNSIKEAMTNAGHAIHCGLVYRKHPEGLIFFFFVKPFKCRN